MLQLKELKDFSAGKLSQKRGKEIQQIILDHPFYFEIIADLNRIEKSLPNGTDVIQHLESGKEAYKQLLFSK